MKGSTRAWVAGIVAVAALLGTFAVAGSSLAGGFSLASSALSPSVILPPCAVTVLTENGLDNAVQSTINAYPGQVVCVGPGTFPEQLTISSAGTTLRGAGAAKTIIEPSSLSLNTVDFDSAATPHAAYSSLTPTAAIILVNNTTGVTISNLQVNGAVGTSFFSSCADNYVGVDFQNSSGTLTKASVKGVELPAPLFGCQDGLAVYAYNGFFYAGSAPSSPVAVTVSHSTISAYDKNGVTCDDPMEACSVALDTVLGIGPTPSIAQNGVQVAYGATATISGDTIKGNSYTGSATTNSWYANGYSSAGVLLYDSNATTVSNNKIVQNQDGIAYYDDGQFDTGPVQTAITHNTVDQSNGYGVVVTGAPGGADNVTIASNTVNNSEALNPSIWGAPGILVDTGNFVLTHNVLSGSSNASGASNGPFQTVCGPSANTGIGTPLLYCSADQNLRTAAIQAASESSSDLTNVVLMGNVYHLDSAHIATLGVLGGSVNLEEIS